MCIAAWIWQSHASHQFLLLLNRDEFHDRPTRPMEWWGEGEEDLLAGRDELGGGTWLGCSRGGRIAFVTNFREPESRFPGAKSRGHLPVKFLKSQQTPMEFAEEIAKEADSYNPFNLVVADLCSKTMVFVSNRPEGEPTIETVNPGIHVLSNASLDSPWPKSELLRSKVEEFLKTQGDKEIPLKDMVRELMGDKVKADRDMLPITGCNPEWEYALSSIYVDLDTEWGHYGTRSMSGIAVKANNEVSFYERYIEDGTWEDHLVEFQIRKQ
ncbi:uncharacterized protein LOC144558504 isoform X2 [Carex rostrata]